MEKEFYPWKLEIDLNKTKQFYENSKLVVESKINKEFETYLTNKQKEFFISFGIDINKINVICNEGLGYKKIFEAKFIFAGKLLSLTNMQFEVYKKAGLISDKDEQKIEIVPLDDMILEKNKIDNMTITFKHPVTLYESKEFEKWECGYICCCAILKIK